MNLVISDKSILPDFMKVSIAFEVKSFYDVELKNGGLNGYDIVEKKVDEPYIIDHDNDQNEPYTWEKKIDISNWGFFVIYDEDKPAAGAITAYKSPKVNMLEGRQDIAVLWNLRVNPEYRGQGLGKQLIDEVKKWSKERCCKYLKIETQNFNVNACKFYKAMGAKLEGIRRHAYKGEQEHEVQFLWYIDLAQE